MGKLSLQPYAWKCVLGTEVVYVLCVLGGLMTWRNVPAQELHHRLFELLPGFTWLTGASFILGAIYVGVFAWICAWYYVWMHNSSLVEKTR